MHACAFLPFLPLIVDAQIRQLGDDDFAKREAAVQMLQKSLEDTDGFRNYSVLLAVKKAARSINAEARKRAQQLYTDNLPRYFQEHSHVCIVLNMNDTGDLQKYAKRVSRVHKIFGPMILRACTGADEGEWLYQFFKIEDFSHKDFVRLKSIEEVKGLVPVSNPKTMPRREFDEKMVKPFRH